MTTYFKNLTMNNTQNNNQIIQYNSLSLDINKIATLKGQGHEIITG
jgi:hypothetical protein